MQSRGCEGGQPAGGSPLSWGPVMRGFRASAWGAGSALLWPWRAHHTLPHSPQSSRQVCAPLAPRPGRFRQHSLRTRPPGWIGSHWGSDLWLVAPSGQRPGACGQGPTAPFGDRARVHPPVAFVRSPAWPLGPVWGQELAVCAGVGGQPCWSSRQMQGTALCPLLREGRGARCPRGGRPADRTQVVPRRGRSFFSSWYFHKVCEFPNVIVEFLLQKDSCK